ncbi:type II CRISPR-associated endonuclease Cas1 [Rhodocyclus tenuis]|uniref:type II CRISPR-associated endonuclease Cas1 n=1 Tax=Rhodocyclus tenuis TaxID=1066 RepID=UPI0019067C16|nr:type II CRISPR-associated endonuclease Cas1 [Rhodocyclus tenuis]
MIKRIVEISHPSSLRLKNEQLVIERDGAVVSTVPIEDLGILLLAHPGNVFTQQVLAACQQAGVAVVLCDEKFLPIALFLSLRGGALHTATLHMQVQAKAKVANSIWRDIVEAKILAQARHLASAGRCGEHLEMLARRVSAEDATQHEAQAAAYYWRQLLGAEFRRDTHAEGFNALLNYGYAILRAAVARAIVGTGLHPALGLFHHNRSDNFALADDLMEPLRPAVDSLVRQEQINGRENITPVTKRAMLELLSSNVDLLGQALPLWVALQRYAASVKSALAGNGQKVEIPVWHFSGATEPCG